jgi:hypothetical protein
MKKIAIIVLIFGCILNLNAQIKISALPTKSSKPAATDQFIINDLSGSAATKKITWSWMQASITDTANILRRSLRDTAVVLRTLIGGLSGWTLSGGFLYPTSTFTYVGIGRTTAYYPLDVNGTINSTLITSLRASFLDVNSNTYITGGSTGSGGGNVAIGQNAFSNNYTGQSNTILGSGAFRYGTTGSYNTMIGYSGGSYYTTNGNNNVFIGAYAGTRLSGDNNICIGYLAGYFASGSNKLFIDISNTSTPLFWADFNTRRVIINGSLTTTDTLVLPAHGIKFYDGSYQTTSAISALIGVTQSGPNYNTLYGYGAGINTTGINGQNVKIGYLSGNAASTSQSNVFLGSRSGYNTTSGYSNIFLGTNAGYSNTTGHGNIHIGDSAGLNFTNLNNRIIIGSGTKGLDTTKTLIFGNQDSKQLTINGSLNIGTAGQDTINGSENQKNVSGISYLEYTGSATIVLKGLIGGIKGQHLTIIVTSSGILYLWDNSTGSQKFRLYDAQDAILQYAPAPSSAGIFLVCDGSKWIQLAGNF